MASASSRGSELGEAITVDPISKAEAMSQYQRRAEESSALPDSKKTKPGQ